MLALRGRGRALLAFGSSSLAICRHGGLDPPSRITIVSNRKSRHFVRRSLTQKQVGSVNLFLRICAVFKVFQDLLININRPKGG